MKMLLVLWLGVWVVALQSKEILVERAYGHQFAGVHWKSLWFSWLSPQVVFAPSLQVCELKNKNILLEYGIQVVLLIFHNRTNVECILVHHETSIWSWELGKSMKDIIAALHWKNHGLLGQQFSTATIYSILFKWIYSQQLFWTNTEMNILLEELFLKFIHKFSWDEAWVFYLEYCDGGTALRKLVEISPVDNFLI